MRIQKSATVYPVVNGGKNFINLYERIKIMKLKIFDVVELNDNNRATILNINNKEYLAEIVNSAGISLGNRIITDNDINKVILAKSKVR